MAHTKGINHLGLSVKDLKKSTSFFVDVLGWSESGYDGSYPRTAVSDGVARLTLWQTDQSLKITGFNRRTNVGLHHLALEVNSEEKLKEIHVLMKNQPEVNIEFPPEFIGSGPRKHMMCYEPGGIRIEFLWQGQ
jgi:catechol 2,3-dioxygenase-like lactoylglutathione lyase family enzyme